MRPHPRIFRRQTIGSQRSTSRSPGASRRSSDEWRHAPYQRVLIDIALVEREIDRARRAFGMFYEVFSQRGASFAPELAAHDVIAEDCYDAVRQQAPRLLDGNALAPISYMEHGYSPATKRRGVVLARLLGETNPFPMIRVPWDRDNPWDPVFLHELAHNLQADMRIWQENRIAVARRVLIATSDPALVGDLWPLAQGNFRRSRGAATRRSGGGLGHGAVSRPSRPARTDLSPRGRASDRISARTDAGRNAAAHGLRASGGADGARVAAALRHATAPSDAAAAA